MFDDALLAEIRNRFAQVDTCPVEGPRVFFENAGGALTLNTVVETSAKFAAIPDNQGRANAGSTALSDTIAKAKSDAMTVFGVSEGQIIVGESGTELLFRMIMNACLGVTKPGQVLGSTLEHPASRSAARRWAGVAGLEYVAIPHDDATGCITSAAYSAAVTPQTRVATIVHTSPVTGMGVDVSAISAAIRAVAPECIIIVDGIQHAAHGAIDIGSYDVDGYAVSPYKMFSRHGYGIAWLGPRLSDLPHDALDGGPEDNWELGTRDTGSYATFSDVVDYLEWLGKEVGGKGSKRDLIEAAGRDIHRHEKSLTDAMLFGTGNLKGLTELVGVKIVGGADNPAREGLVCAWVEGMPSAVVVDALRDAGVRVHIRKNDHYSGNILGPLGQDDCIRVSMCHYNSLPEVAQFLTAMAEITS